jgi:hypothetical protein
MTQYGTTINDYVNNVMKVIEEHLIEELAEAGVENTPANRAAYYQAIRRLIEEDPADNSLATSVLKLRLTLKAVMAQNDAMLEGLDIRH